MKEIDEQFLKEIVRIVAKKIREINASIADSNDSLKNVDEYDKVINHIRENNTCFASPDFKNKIQSVLASVKLEDKSILTQAIDDLDYLCFLAECIDNGVINEYKESELAIVERLIKAIEQIKTISLAENDSYRQSVSKKTSELELCTSLYDKLRKGDEGLFHFQNQEIMYLLNILASKEMTYRYRVLDLINRMEEKINENNIAFLEADMEDFEDEQEQIEEIDEDLIISIFNKYNFDFTIFNDKQKHILRTRCDLGRIEEVLEVLTSHPEYEFVKQYGKSRNINEKIRSINIRKLFFVIRFASKETLEYLIEDAKARGVRVEDIFTVNGVYKKVSRTKENPGPSGEPTDDDYLSGSYEYYKINSNLLDKLSKEYNATHSDADVDFYRQVLDTSPDVLATPSDVVARNIKFANIYGINLVGDDHFIKAPTVLTSRIFIHLVDVLIENSDDKNDFFGYLFQYPSILKEEKSVRKILYKLYKGYETTVVNPNTNRLKGIRSTKEPYDLDEVINRDNIENLIANIPDSLITYIDENEYNIDKFIQDEYISRLDNDPNVGENEHAYVINGVRVSKLKFKRIWTLIMKSGLADNIDKDQLFILALTYNSYYRDSDLKALKEYVSSLGLKG